MLSGGGGGVMKLGDLLAYKVVGNFPSSPHKFPTSPSYLPHQYILPFCT